MVWCRCFADQMGFASGYQESLEQELFGYYTLLLKYANAKINQSPLDRLPKCYVCVLALDPGSKFLGRFLTSYRPLHQVC